LSAEYLLRTIDAASVIWGTGLPIMMIGTNLVGIQAMHEDSKLLCNLVIGAKFVSLP
jgi:hypothetical protein